MTIPLHKWTDIGTAHSTGRPRKPNCTSEFVDDYADAHPFLMVKNFVAVQLPEIQFVVIGTI